MLMLAFVCVSTPAFARLTQGDTERFNAEIAAANRRWGLPAHALKAMIQQESKFDTDARSSTGAIGLGQFTGVAVKEVRRIAKMSKYKSGYAGQSNLLSRLQTFTKTRARDDPATAIEASALYLKFLLDQNNGNLDAALTHYNAGGKMAYYVRKYGYENARRRGLLTGSQSRNYVRHVRGWMRRFANGERFDKSSGKFVTGSAPAGSGANDGLSGNGPVIPRPKPRPENLGGSSLAPKTVPIPKRRPANLGKRSETETSSVGAAGVLAGKSGGKTGTGRSSNGWPKKARLKNIRVRLPVRSKQQRGSRIIGYIPKNATIEITGPGKWDWFPVKINGKTGYIPKQFFEYK